MPSPSDINLENQLRYKTIFDSDVVGIVESQVDGFILNANDYFLKMVGYSREELEKGELNWVKFTAPDSREKSILVAQKLGEHKAIESFEKEYIHKDGSRVSALVNPTLYRDGTIIAIVLDISNRKKIEKALAEGNIALEERVSQRTQELQRSEQFLEAIFENIPNMVFVKDAENLRFVRFNRAGEELIGVPRSEMMGKNDYDYFPKEQADFFTSKDRDVLKKHEVVDIPEEAIQTAHGTRYLHTKKIPIFNKHGKPEYLLGVSEDITEKKKAEQQQLALLQEQIAREIAEARAKQMGFLSEMSSVLTESFDLNKILTSFCRNVVNFMADVCVVDLISEEDATAAFSECACKSAEDEILVCDSRKKYPLRWKDSAEAVQVLRTGKSELTSAMASSLMFVPVRLRGQKPFGVVTFVLKDSPKGYNEVELFLAEEISKRLAIAVENSRLYYNAQEASRAKSAFLATVSHEIRTPLNAIVGFTSLLLDSKLSYDQKDYTQSIRVSSNTLLSLINDILDVSKIEAGKLVLESTEFDLRSIYADVVDIIADTVTQKKLELVSFIDPQIPRSLKGDPARLKQIFLNLLHNAIKFTSAGNISVRGQLSSSRENRMKIRFEIQDTGIGIEPQLLGYLFKPFSQVDSSTTRRYGGTGLGLSICKQLVESMGGEVGVTSVPGQGSTFWFDIELEAMNREPAGDLLPSSLINRSVLIFVKNQALQEFLELQLEELKLKPYFVSSDEMEFARSLDPLVIIFDQINFPFSPELQTQILRDASRNFEIPLIHLVDRSYNLAHLSPVQRINYLKKPVLQQNLQKCILEVLHLVDIQAEEPTPNPQGQILRFGVNKPRVLLVEDNAINQRVALLMLEKIGCNVDVAANGIEALKSLELFSYDLIFMDCQMPEMDGYEATRNIRRMSNPTAEIPIIALTANAFKEDQEKCLEAGMDDFVTKPVESGTLEKKLMQYLWRPKSMVSNHASSLK